MELGHLLEISRLLFRVSGVSSCVTSLTEGSSLFDNEIRDWAVVAEAAY